MVTDPITTDSCNMTAKGLFVLQSFTLMNMTRAQFDGAGLRQQINDGVADQNLMFLNQVTYGVTERWEIDAIPLPIAIVPPTIFTGNTRCQRSSRSRCKVALRWGIPLPLASGA